MTHRNAVLVLVVVLTAVVMTSADHGPAKPLHPDQHFDVTAYRESDGWIIADTNGDGMTDYALKLDHDMRKQLEAIDFSNDGRMDNFYFYRREALIREEIDTNHDGRIDLWVYIEGGVYIVRYERDTNHDGTIDFVRRFDEQ
ncbi:MAG: hypothetical protein EA384_06930 [Spirochaetaceae bacterium]|nr:MAG: hypothetical protein EA384_06930 [Spirochaetaceae bacterium]